MPKPRSLSSRDCESKIVEVTEGGLAGGFVNNVPPPNCNRGFDVGKNWSVGRLGGSRFTSGGGSGRGHAGETLVFWFAVEMGDTFVEMLADRLVNCVEAAANARTAPL